MRIKFHRPVTIGMSASDWVVVQFVVGALYLASMPTLSYMFDKNMSRPLQGILIAAIGIFSALSELAYARELGVSREKPGWPYAMFIVYPIFALFLFIMGTQVSLTFGPVLLFVWLTWAWPMSRAHLRDIAAKARSSDPQITPIENAPGAAAVQ